MEKKLLRKMMGDWYLPPPFSTALILRLFLYFCSDTRIEGIDYAKARLLSLINKVSLKFFIKKRFQHSYFPVRSVLELLLLKTSVAAFDLLYYVL